MAASAQVRQRLVQYQGRRYSLKLEPQFWAVLTAAAKARDMRLGRLVATLSAEAPPGANLSSYLRVFCLTHVQSPAERERGRPARTALAAGAANLDLVVDQCPARCLIVSHDRRILRTNDAFRRWYGPGDANLMNQPFEHFFQLRAGQAIGGLFRAFGARNLDWARGELLFVTPGRVVETGARLVAVARRSAEDFAVLIMLDEAPG